MRVQNFYSLLLSALLIVFFSSCKNKKSNPIVDQEEAFIDSISHWLSKSNAPNNSIYRINLQKALSAIPLELSDSLKSKYSVDLSMKYLKLDDSVNFSKANKMAKYWAIEVNDSLNLANAYWDAGSFFRNRNDADSSYFNHAKAHKLYDALGNDYNKGRILYNMANNLKTIKDYTTAETYTIQAIELIKPLEKKDKLDKLYKCYNLLGILANNLKDYDKALEHHRKALEYLELMDDKRGKIPRSQNNIGSVYLAQGKYTLALEQFLKVFDSDSLNIKNPGLYAKALGNCGYSEFKLGDSTNTRYKFNRAIAIKDSIGDLASLSLSFYTMSEFLFYAKDTLGAFTYAKKAMQTSQASDNNLRVLETLGLLSKIDQKNASSYFQEYEQLNDSLQISERRARNKFERIRFETNETLAENVLLSRQKQLWTGIAATLLLLAIATYIIIDQRRKNEKLRFEEEQQQSNRRIFDLLLAEKTKIEEGKKLAQKRISEELHDGVQGRMQGIRMLLLGLNKRNTSEAIEERAEAIKELKSVQEEVRAISHELSHAAYQKIYSFIATIQELLNEVRKNASLQSKFVFDESFDWDALDSDIKINVYRIIQECIQNCVKYASAEQVEVTFDIKKDHMLSVTIEDNGKGFQVKTNRNGIGMRNINSRIEKLGGQWEIESKIGEGTKVILYIPTSNPENPSLKTEMKIA